MTSLPDKSAGDAAKDILEGVAVSTWVYKMATDADPEDSKGRIVPTARVHNDAEYAAVAGGQIVVGHFLLPIIAPIILAFWAVTALLSVGAPSLHIDHLFYRHSTSGTHVATIVVASILFVAWLYIVVWRITIKAGFKWLLNRGPKVKFADDYRGVMNSVRQSPPTSRSSLGSHPE